MRRPLALVLCLFSLSVTPAYAAEGDELWECVALREDVGRDEPDMAAELSRWPDDRLRSIEKDASYYTGIDPAAPWIELYAARNGHGSSLIGFLKTENFACTPASQ